jgi:hypothetical protein
MELITNLINSVKTTLDSINETIKKYQPKSKVSDRDRKLQIAIDTAEDIIDRYEYVDHINRQAYLGEGDIRLELKILGNTDLPPLRPRYYKYWSDFSPEVGLEVLKTLQSSNTTSDRVIRIIRKLEVVLKPFRIQPAETISTPSLGLKPYKFSSYAVWHNSFSDHGMTYALWRECGFE